MSEITFETKVFELNSWMIVRLPEATSAKLPSRGQIMVTGTINGHAFTTPLEPDGKWSHWFKLEPALQQTLHVTAGDTVRLELETVKNWPEPNLPSDLKQALQSNAQVQDLWKQITPMARWEWIRWIRSTNNSETRQRRVDVAISKLKSGKRRPCCWNRNLCTEPAVSKNGILLAVA